MAYLHEDKEEFINAVNLASEYFHILPVVVEKDYYVTMILRELSERQGFVPANRINKTNELCINLSTEETQRKMFTKCSAVIPS